MMASEGFTLKGWHVALIFIGCFGVIIGVNLVMASQAIRTWPGQAVENSYVASQEFDEKKAAQLELGWQSRVEYEEGTLLLIFEDENGQFVEPSSLEITIGRPATATEDQILSFEKSGDHYELRTELEKGEWLVYVRAIAQNGASFEQKHELYIPS